MSKGNAVVAYKTSRRCIQDIFKMATKLELKQFTIHCEKLVEDVVQGVQHKN